MSNYTLVRIECDAADCQETVVVGSRHGGTNITLARREADKQGWQHTQFNDFCREHRTTDIPFHTFVPASWGSKQWCDGTVTSKRGVRRCGKYIDHIVHTGGQP